MSFKDKNTPKSTASKVTIKIPGTLYNRLSEIVSGSGFNSVTDFVVYVLRDLVSTSYESTSEGRMKEGSLSKEEIDAIRRRLKSLGYL
ncbi:CopG family transcriptional regulator [bacterium]|nr:CopG family transcriptional regulator [bacterium]